jgi:hypothetical protein
MCIEQFGRTYSIETLRGERFCCTSQQGKPMVVTGKKPTID